MKLRIKGNSIRLRLSKPEVEMLSSAGIIKEQTDFAGNSFVYCLKKDTTGELKASFTNNQLVVFIPGEFVHDWPGNNIVGIDNKLVDGSLPQLYILVEKDFKCIDDTTEDQSDNYDNPKTC
ncbi:MAG: hypothetical protein V4685_13670 [Bacteroidota bacterium]